VSKGHSPKNSYGPCETGETKGEKKNITTESQKGIRRGELEAQMKKIEGVMVNLSEYRDRPRAGGE